MKYFKLIRDGVIVDAICAETAAWMVENPRSLSVYVGPMEAAKGVLSSDGATVWHIDGKDKFADFPDYPTVLLEEIGPGEYQMLSEEIEAGRTIVEESQPGEENGETPGNPNAPQTCVELLRKQVAALEKQNNLLTDCILEISEMLYS